jgi:hypothetical protein
LSDAKDDQKCYQCGAKAVLTVSVPPEIIFPEKDEFEIDFKNSSIIIPSCKTHVLNGNSDFNYFVKIIKSVEWNNVFAHCRDRLAIEDTSSVDFSTKNCNVDILKLARCVSVVANGILYHVLGKQFRGKIESMVVGFLESQFDAMSILRMSFNGLIDTYPRQGKYPQAFSYQLIPAKEVFSQFKSPDYYKGNGLFLRLSFYEGAEFYLLLKE